MVDDHVRGSDGRRMVHAVRPRQGWEGA